MVLLPVSLRLFLCTTNPFSYHPFIYISFLLFLTMFLYVRGGGGDHSSSCGMSSIIFHHSQHLLATMVITHDIQQ
ncbi:hypothetical protein Hdeb2414_s0006g00192961 [Helianthus debilis subsp. tardiflorus]